LFAGSEARFSELVKNLTEVNDEGGRINEMNTHFACWKKKENYQLWEKGKKGQPRKM
jgi:hypothetical protein